MGQKTFEKYAKYYDALYAEKTYEKECDFVEEVFQRYSQSKPVDILDAGCGTGGHLIPLTMRGYNVVGVDASESMISIAKEKTEKLGLRAEVSVGDIRSFNLNRKFDACISMFAVINYITSTTDLLKAFKNIRRHLNQDALFTFDFWYGPAVLTIKPSIRVKVIEKEDKRRIIRIVEPELDTFNHTCKSKYYLVAIKDDVVIDEIRESHMLRYLFPQEIIHYLNESGFEALKLCEFPHIDKAPSESTWNTAMIAKAR